MRDGKRCRRKTWLERKLGCVQLLGGHVIYMDMYLREHAKHAKMLLFASMLAITV